MLWLLGWCTGYLALFIFEFDFGSHDCNLIVMRMRHCSLCAGYPLTNPCPSLCEASLAHCMRPIRKIETTWTDLIGGYFAFKNLCSLLAFRLTALPVFRDLSNAFAETDKPRYGSSKKSDRSFSARFNATLQDINKQGTEFGIRLAFQ